MGIPTGSVLTSTVSGQTAITSGPKKVILNNKEMSLTAATREILDLQYSVAPGPYWSYDGKTISDIYEDTYTAEN
jgi:hypothetical protein